MSAYAGPTAPVIDDQYTELLRKICLSMKEALANVGGSTAEYVTLGVTQGSEYTGPITPYLQDTEYMLLIKIAALSARIAAATA